MFYNTYDEKGHCRSLWAKLPHFITKPLDLRIRGKVLREEENKERKLTMKLRTEIMDMAKKENIAVGK